jgi:hypothetical protein
MSHNETHQYNFVWIYILAQSSIPNAQRRSIFVRFKVEITVDPKDQNEIVERIHWTYCAQNISYIWWSCLGNETCGKLAGPADINWVFIYNWCSECRRFMNSVFCDLFTITFNSSIHCRGIQYLFQNKTEMNTNKSQNKLNEYEMFAKDAKEKNNRFYVFPFTE